MKKYRESIMKVVFLMAACVSILAVVLICGFLFVNGFPAIAEIGPLKFLTGVIWKPQEGEFGIPSAPTGGSTERKTGAAGGSDRVCPLQTGGAGTGTALCGRSDLYPKAHGDRSLRCLSPDASLLCPAGSMERHGAKTVYASGSCTGSASAGSHPSGGLGHVQGGLCHAQGVS